MKRKKRKVNHKRAAHQKKTKKKRIPIITPNQRSISSTRVRSGPPEFKLIAAFPSSSCNTGPFTGKPNKENPRNLGHSYLRKVHGHFSHIYIYTYTHPEDDNLRQIGEWASHTQHVVILLYTLPGATFHRCCRLREMRPEESRRRPCSLRSAPIPDD